MAGLNQELLRQAARTVTSSPKKIIKVKKKLKGDSSRGGLSTVVASAPGEAISPIVEIVEIPTSPQIDIRKRSRETAAVSKEKDLEKKKKKIKTAAEEEMRTSTVLRAENLASPLVEGDLLKLWDSPPDPFNCELKRIAEEEAVKRTSSELAAEFAATAETQRLEAEAATKMRAEEERKAAEEAETEARAKAKLEVEAAAKAKIAAEAATKAAEEAAIKAKAAEEAAIKATAEAEAAIKAKAAEEAASKAEAARKAEAAAEAEAAAKLQADLKKRNAEMSRRAEIQRTKLEKAPEGSTPASRGLRTENALPPLPPRPESKFIPPVAGSAVGEKSLSSFELKQRRQDGERARRELIRRTDTEKRKLPVFSPEELSLTATDSCGLERSEGPVDFDTSILIS